MTRIHVQLSHAAQANPCELKRYNIAHRERSTQLKEGGKSEGCAGDEGVWVAALADEGIAVSTVRKRKSAR